MNIEKDKQTLKDMRDLKKILKQIPADRKAIGEKLVTEILFMSDTLSKLKSTIDKKGVVDNFKQGKQQFMRESPALKAYNVTLQRYSLFYKQLTDLLPKPQLADKNKNELIEFLHKYL
ncbi:MAG: hypothetical protein LBU94_00065 [Clostridiales bacterium]|jgi:predicted DNA-binding protein YlxM (UPF0122 family)|nr:hypothetical protein [Clostridiales bacterium]